MGSMELFLGSNNRLEGVCVTVRGGVCVCVCVSVCCVSTTHRECMTAKKRELAAGKISLASFICGGQQRM